MKDLCTNHQTLAHLRALTIKNDTYAEVETALNHLMDRRRAENMVECPLEARGIAIMGGTGAGKSRLLRSVKEKILKERRMDGVRPIVYCSVPSPASLKHVGASLLEALGQEMKSSRTAHYIWQHVRALLEINETLVVIIDEAQDLVRSHSKSDREDVVNTLKSLMKAPEWPVSLVLAGVPEVRDTQGLRFLLEHDAQLSRRFNRIEFPQLDPNTCEQELQKIIEFYSSEAGVAVCPRLFRQQVISRLMVACERQFGLSIEVIADSVGNALLGQTNLNLGSFAKVFHDRTCAKEGFNPFISDAFNDLPSLLPRPEEGFGKGRPQ